jgi:hypothetical protein
MDEEDGDGGDQHARELHVPWHGRTTGSRFPSAAFRGQGARPREYAEDGPPRSANKPPLGVVANCQTVSRFLFLPKLSSQTIDTIMTPWRACDKYGRNVST